MSAIIEQTNYPHFCSEIVEGTYDGTNVNFTLTREPVFGTIFLENKSGLMLHDGTDFTISGKTLAMTVPPDSGDQLFAQYKFW